MGPGRRHAAPPAPARSDPGGPGPADRQSPPPADPSAPLIEFAAASYRYPDRPAEEPPALATLQLRIRRGEFVAVLGGNGSGKSTLIRLADGLLVPTAGRIAVEGLDTRDPAARVAVRQRVGVVFQNPDDQIVAAVVGDDVAFGPENLGCPREEIGRRVREALAVVGMAEHAEADPQRLSGGQKQRVAIAGVLAMRPLCLCLDEPTSLLDPVGRAEVAAALRAVHAAGAAVVLVTHHAEEAAGADRVIVLQQGHLVADAAPGQLLADPERLRAWGVQPPPALLAWRALTARGVAVPGPCLTLEALADAVAGAPVHGSSPAAAPAGPAPPPSAPEPRAPPRPPSEAATGVLLREVGYRYPDPAVPARARRPALDGVSLRVAPGECLALLGATGSGKTTAARHCCALLRPDSGTASVDGIEPWASRGRRRVAALRALRRRAAMVFQHPEDQFFEESVLAEVAFAPRNYGEAPAQAKAAARQALRSVGVPPEIDARSPFGLSGGQMRRVALACVLAARPRYLLLDEPTAGLDADGRAEVIALVRALLVGGVGVLLITHRMDEAVALADRAAVLHRGRLVAEGAPGEVFARAAELGAWGLEPPPGPALALAVRRRGLDVAAPAAADLESAVEAIAATLGAVRARG